MRKFILQVLLCAWAVFSINPSAPAAGVSAHQQILFVCTGNYYRSRFAEALFNQKAGRAASSWKAVSRGLQLFPTQHGMYPEARQELIKRGVAEELCEGTPTALTRKDLEKSDYIVLMDETEHRPMLEKQFPNFSRSKIHYWHIGEADQMATATACRKMSTQIDTLLKTLGH